MTWRQFAAAANRLLPDAASRAVATQAAVDTMSRLVTVSKPAA